MEAIGPYMAERADMTLRLHGEVWSQLTETGDLAQVYSSIDQPLCDVLFDMERTGVLLKKEELAQRRAPMVAQLDLLQAQAWQAAGEEFNLNSHKQLHYVLFEKLGLPVLKKTRGGAPSTDAETIHSLAEEHELPALITQHRSTTKLLQSVDGLPLHCNEATGRIHPTYAQASTTTGRLSCHDPNLQNIPRGEDCRWIRQSFGAPEGYQILSADYSQIELRIMAHLSGDKTMVEAFHGGKDIHTETAAEIFNTSPEEVTEAQRQEAKTVNFGLVYGMSAHGLAKQLGIDRKEARAYMDAYFQRYPGVQAYMKDTCEQAAMKGYVETIFGRRVYIANINSRNANLRKEAERLAINAPIQGTGADLIKRAMIAVHGWLKAHPELGVRMTMQVHDELVFEVPDQHVELVSQEVQALMSNTTTLSVPVVVNAGVGPNWGDAH